MPNTAIQVDNLEFRDMINKNCIITVDERYFRPSQVNNLLRDSSKAIKNLGWEVKVPFKEIVQLDFIMQRMIRNKNAY